MNRSSCRSASPPTSAMDRKSRLRLRALVALVSSMPVFGFVSFAPSPAHASPLDETQESAGFDRCGYVSTSEMQYLYENTRSYQGDLGRTFGVYIGGPNLASCYVATSSWVSAVNSEGWGVAPLWVGAQMPEAGEPGSPSYDCQVWPYKAYNEYINPGTAYSQGESDGAAAITSAENAGFGPPNIIYLDLEGYDSTNSTCTSAANAYISGFVYEVEYQNVFYAGVYGSLDSTIDALAAAVGQPGQYVPYVVWPAACGSGTNDSQSCDTNVWNLSGVSNSSWTYDQRLYQWDTDRTVFVGDQTFYQPTGIDVDCIDGIAAGGLAESVWDPGTINGGESNEVNSPSDDVLC